jgi:hypothetical protein
VQNAIFFECTARRRIMTKGRRLGFTQGGSQAFIEWMLEGAYTMLWGDTVNGNIDRYVERYWMPAMRPLPRSMWDYSKQAKKMYIGDSVCDFRSADNPSNWEGFGYDYILLNEAGIILKNPYLYENAVRPMLLDNPESVLIAGGTPKGLTPPVFYDLWRHEYEGKPDWKSFQFSSFHNPFLPRREIDELIKEMSDIVIRQEIYGEFISHAEDQFIEGDIVDEAVARVIPSHAYHDAIKVLGIDIARFGTDQTVLYFRQGVETMKVIKKRGLDTNEAVTLIAGHINEWQPDGTLIDIGYNPGVYDNLVKLGFKIIPVQFGAKSSDQYYRNMRAEMWGRMRNWLAEGGSIPNDRELRQQLIAQTYKFAGHDGSQIQLTSKEDLKKDGHPSPDIADALALTFAVPIRRQPRITDQPFEARKEYAQYEENPLA